MTKNLNESPQPLYPLEQLRIQVGYSTVYFANRLGFQLDEYSEIVTQLIEPSLSPSQWMKLSDMTGYDFNFLVGALLPENEWRRVPLDERSYLGWQYHHQPKVSTTDSARAISSCPRSLGLDF